jgi:hypothetical protein
MFNIIDETTGLLLFAKSDNEVIEGQIAISEICTIERENPFDSEIYFNFETQEFYTK